ncbi:zonadhesin-like [Patiria miniata]|uniref:Antistasin-like domain-containing protein n=1 Tax=Patiria miniata TaxID=46514 RepID=A0A914A3V9_PATMI|nr:zonadhesin-like [Patiria miniata]
MVSVSDYLIFLLGCSSFLAARAGVCSNHGQAPTTTTKKAGVDCVECDITCALPLQRDENGCEICSCILPQCEGLFPTWCTNPCSQQSCSEYRTNGELDDSQCVPREGDVTCQTGCGCPDGRAIDDLPDFPFAECVAKEECGCSDSNAPDGYLKLGYKYKKTESEEVCTCGSNNIVDCVFDPKPQCPVVNGCGWGCQVIPGRSGCEICVCT